MQQLTKKQQIYWEKVKDGRCRCGGLQSEHGGFHGHGELNQCEKFTWIHNVDGTGRRVP